MVYEEANDRLRLTPSVLGNIFTTNLGYDETTLLILGRVYGVQKINGQSLYYYDIPHEFLKLCKIAK